MNKMLSLLGFAAKAGKLSYGMQAAKEAMNAKTAVVAIAACDISEKSKKEVRFFAEKNSLRFLLPADVDIAAVSNAVGKKCGILTINDSGFAEAFLKAYEGGNANDK